MTQGSGLSDSTHSCNSRHLDFHRTASNQCVTQKSFPPFPSHIFPQPCWVSGPFSKLRLIKRSALCKMQDQYGHIQMVQRTENNIFFFKFNTASLTQTIQTDRHERSWGNADIMVHIFDRHMKWQDGENVQCLTCDSYIRSGKKFENVKNNPKQQNPQFCSEAVKISEELQAR